MPNIKSQVKRVKTNEKRRQFNASYKASMRTAIKNVEVAIENKNVEAAKEAYNTANKKLDKAVAKGICHKNFAARQKSRLSKKNQRFRIIEYRHFVGVFYLLNMIKKGSYLSQVRSFFIIFFSLA